MSLRDLLAAIFEKSLPILGDEPPDFFDQSRQRGLGVRRDNDIRTARAISHHVEVFGDEQLRRAYGNGLYTRRAVLWRAPARGFEVEHVAKVFEPQLDGGRGFAWTATAAVRFPLAQTLHEHVQRFAWEDGDGPAAADELVESRDHRAFELPSEILRVCKKAQPVARTRQAFHDKSSFSRAMPTTRANRAASCLAASRPASVSR